jgi:hypothetical protein
MNGAVQVECSASFCPWGCPENRTAPPGARGKFVSKQTENADIDEPYRERSSGFLTEEDFSLA